MSSDAGKARNARLNQAMKHLNVLQLCISQLQGYSKYEHVDLKEDWKEGRNVLADLVQCFHEANAYNNMTKP